MARPDVSQLRPLLDPARHVAVLLPSNPQYDTVASALALKVALSATSKDLLTCCATPVTVEFNRLVGIDTVSTTLGSKNLIIGFADQTELVDKVSYNLEKGELQLVITPKSSTTELDHRRLRFVPATPKIDIAILVGVGSFSDLGQLYTDAKEMLSTAQVISLTRDLPKENYTTHQVYSPEASCLSELMAQIIDSLSLPLDQDIATNLLSGLENATDNFRNNSVNSATFETAALLMRKGARRHQPILSSSFPPGAIPGQTPPVDPPKNPPQTNPILTKAYGTDSKPTETNNNGKPPPSDWYEPKIYRGRSLQ